MKIIGEIGNDGPVPEQFPPLFGGTEIGNVGPDGTGGGAVELEQIPNTPL